MNPNLFNTEQIEKSINFKKYLDNSKLFIKNNNAYINIYNNQSISFINQTIEVNNSNINFELPIFTPAPTPKKMLDKNIPVETEFGLPMNIKEIDSYIQYCNLFETHFGLLKEQKLIGITKAEVLAILEKDGLKLENYPQFMHDRDVVLAAILQNAEALKFSSSVFQDDKEIVLLAVSQNPSVLKFSSTRLKDNFDVVLTAISKDNSAIEYASLRLNKDRELFKAVISQNKEKQAFLKEVSQNGSKLQFASEEFKNDQDIVMAAIANYPLSISYASDTIKKTKKIALFAVAQENDGDVLAYLHDDLRGDFDVGLKAVTTTSKAFSHVSTQLKENLEIALVALSQDPYLFPHVGENLQKIISIEHNKEKRQPSKTWSITAKSMLQQFRLKQEKDSLIYLLIENPTRKVAKL